MDPGVLDRVVKGLKVTRPPELLVGVDGADDAGVYQLSGETALIQTLDFLTPVTDSPYDFGRIAAANSLSDVYAMGGRPLTAMNIVCFPTDSLPEEVLAETLAGGLETIHESGACLVGGHSVDDAEFKYGLSVTGVVHPKRLLTNGGARTGDALILTKPLGSGLLSTAIKGQVAGAEASRLLVEVCAALNKSAAEALDTFHPTACTDVTGFGFAGHALEMARGAKKRFVVSASSLPVMEGALEYAEMGLLPAGAYRNRDFCGTSVEVFPSVPRSLADLIFDPQTSGGLLVTLPASEAESCLSVMKGLGVEAAVVGEVAGESSCGSVECI
ncbi:selenophosphate synthetase [Desulfoluna butyratoxydans]|uniref:Selenide, water dikinase n=1 Tax=Desulfoluna butyratoxydans TaxID=231438 RepID=A0A4U8YH82_9BACT|nr:selenophosphate synthetase [Desulfoluna butyratoxydans]